MRAPNCRCRRHASSPRRPWVRCRAWQRRRSMRQARSMPRARQRRIRPPQTSVIASRWPDPSSTGSSADPGPATDDSDADAQASLATAPPAVAPAAPAAADVSAARQPVSMQTLLLVVIGALALAGLIGSAIFRLASRRWTSRRPVRGDSTRDLGFSRHRSSIATELSGHARTNAAGRFPPRTPPGERSERQNSR